MSSPVKRVLKYFAIVVGLFLIAGAAYLVALGFIQLLAPRLERARLGTEASA
jgi:hypothetical protein